jgi:adenosylhomocysteine nucleosidase
MMFLDSIMASTLEELPMSTKDLKFAVLISANAEWKVVRPLFPAAAIERSPYGEYFFEHVDGNRLLFFHSGWGKVSAAGGTQYVIDRFHPAHLISLSTCGGIEGRVGRFDIVVAEKAVIYDIHEAMTESTEALEHYTTTLDVPAELPVPATRATVYSADRDLTPAGLRELERRYQAVAVDWESGAIAWVAKRNSTPLLIVRGVSDLVSIETGEAEGNYALFQDNAARVMQGLIGDLPKWITALQCQS